MWLDGTGGLKRVIHATNMVWGSKKKYTGTMTLVRKARIAIPGGATFVNEKRWQHSSQGTDKCVGLRARTACHFIPSHPTGFD